MKKDNLTYLVGGSMPEPRPTVPYADEACSFLGGLSDLLMRQRSMPDVVSFAFFCRRANIARLKREFGDSERRLGRGLAFHITPSNIPINFAFSLAFGILSGCANVVRAPTKPWPQVDAVCRAVRELLDRPEFALMKGRVAVVRYERDDEITGYFSGSCDARIIWGGDASVRSIRGIPIPPRAVEITFADRYSLCVLDERAILDLDEAGLERLADDFYNDTYLVDQNACSSPNLIFWLGRGAPEAREKFWGAVHERAKKYDLQAVHAMDKYSLLCDYLIRRPDVEGVSFHDNIVYRVKLASLRDIESCRGRFGLFFEYGAADIGELAPHVTKRWQTLTYYGADRDMLVRFVSENSLSGIDRIVPVGCALDIGVLWDGFDIVRTLSRILEVRYAVGRK
ncbi:MAG: hypothetical protein LBQ56_03145 [Synergistaceae bacterium]|jgi:hypothetical protein|nr:hypothetical protein [Synergistaceae bacterium]